MKKTVMMRVTPKAKKRIKVASAKAGIKMIEYIEKLSTVKI